MQIHDFPDNFVYTRANWSDDWELQDAAICESFTLVASPAIGQARIIHRHGEILRPYETDYQLAPPLDLLGHYVKVRVPQPDDAEGNPVDPILWYGVIEEESRQRDGDRAGNVPLGAQAYTAYTLDYLLKRKAIDTSVVSSPDGLSESTVQRGIGFNLGPGQPRDNTFAPNCQPFGERAAVFAGELPGSTWSAAEILLYLFAYHGPQDVGGEVKIPFELAGADDQLYVLLPAMQAHGRTVKDLLDSLIDRRRLFGYEVRVNEETTPHTVQIFVFTFNHQPIVTPGGTHIPANEQLKTWDFDDDPTAISPVIHSSEAARFAEVIARGQRRTSCCTLSALDDAFEPDWDAADETAYEAGASGATGYSSMTILEKWDANQAIRKTDRFARVFRRFRVPPAFVFEQAGEPIAPRLDNDSENEHLWYPGLRFSPTLPLLTDHNYAGSKIGDNAVTDNTLAGSHAEPLRPFGMIEIDNRWYLLDRLNQGAFGDLPESGGRVYSCSLRMAADGLAIILDVQGAPQHVIAAGEFAAADSDDAQDWPADLDWQDAYFTLSFQLDSFCEASYPQDVPDAGADAVRRLVIEVPDARLDYVVPGTVVGINEDGELIESNGGYVRDDRARLADIARVASHWYSQTRKAIDVTLTRLDTAFRIGDLITEIGADEEAEEINSVVTQIGFDLIAGTITISTQYAQFDVDSL